MGLDMYLSAKRYLSRYNEQDAEIAKKIQELVDTEHPVTYVTTEVAYWRKANAIHEWFVQNVQGGEDNCSPYYVSQKQISELIVTVDEVLANPEKAEELLPTQSGFFFGDTEYGEYYFEDLRDTKKMLSPYVDNDEFFKEWELEYRSSW
jgi:hypothetical protein